MFGFLRRTISCGENGRSWRICRQVNRNFTIRSNEKLAATTSESKIDRKPPTGSDELAKLYENEIKRGEVVPIFKRSLLFGDKIATKDNFGEYSYRQILEAAEKLAANLSPHILEQGSKVAFLCPNSTIYSVIKFAIWISGQTAVPLSSRHPSDLIRYFVEDSQAQILIATPEYQSKIQPVADALGKRVIYVDHTIIPNENQFDSNQTYNVLDKNKRFSPGSFYRDSNAMILYTSGSTGRPKGAVISHKNIQSQTMCLSDVWRINQNDTILHVLPLNHVHGCINALLCPLSVGAKVNIHTQFDATAIWSSLLNINAPTKDRISVFMAVPTIYNLLIAEYDRVFGKNDRLVESVRAQCEKKIRLMISGSAPLPVNVFKKWESITGHKLLERYGMTEIGMVLSNPYHMNDRIPGTVGSVLPDTTVRLVDDNRVICEVKGERNKGIYQQLPHANSQSIESAAGIGELHIKGPSVFVEYYRKPDETKNAFEDDWFKTGDVAEYKDGIFRILGRTNVDIIKTGGFKVSALEIETHLLEHPSIADVCVVGVPDKMLGQKIAALIVCKTDEQSDTVTLPKLRVFCDERIASYQTPSIIKIIHEIPRNAMGKTNKKEIVRDFFNQTDSNDD